MQKHPPLRERTVGTAWRTLRSFLFVVVIVAVVYTAFSAMVAITTADKCNGPLRADKTWNYLPPRWDCVQTQP